MNNLVFLQIQKTGYSQAGVTDVKKDVHDSNRK